MAEENKKRSFTERVARNITISALVIIFLIGIIGLFVGYSLNATQPLQAGLVFGVSSSLIGYVVTAGLHTWAQELTQRRLLEDTLRAQIHIALKDIQTEAYNQFARQFPKLLPSSYFPPTNISSPDFENELAASITKSRNYFFRGVTARHVSVFLKRIKPDSLHANIMILDPREAQLLMLYVIDRFGDSNMSADDKVALHERVRQEMYYSIVGLYDTAHICPISLRLHRGPVFYRAEILDDRCFIAYYVGPRTTYAVTYAYERGTFFYEAFYKDALHLLQLNAPGIELNAMTGEDELAAFLLSIGCDTPVAELRAEFNKFQEAFNAHA